MKDAKHKIRVQLLLISSSYYESMNPKGHVIAARITAENPDEVSVSTSFTICFNLRLYIKILQRSILRQIISFFRFIFRVSNQAVVPSLS